MDPDTEFYAIWRQFQGKEEQDQATPCAIAVEFLSKVEAMILGPLMLAGETGPSRTQIRHAKYLLQEEYQAWRRSVPTWHLRYAALRHRCLDAVYDACYDRLHLIGLTRRTPMNLIPGYEPPSGPGGSASASQSQIAGIFIGEMEEEG